MCITDKLKILYIGGFELPDKNAAAHRVLANGKIFKSLGYNLIYIGVSHDNTCNRDIHSTRTIADYGTDYKVKYPNNKIEWFRYLWNISDIINIIERNNIKTIVAYNYPALALYRLFKYCKKNDIKLISDCTEWYVPEGTIFFRIIKSLDSFFRMKIIHPKLDGVIAISKFLFEFYSSKNDNVILVPPLVDLSDPKWKYATKRNDFSIPRFIYAGSPGGKTKDHLGKIISILKIYSEEHNKEFCLDIVGLTLNDYNRIWKDNPIPSALKDSFIFHGRLSNQDVIKKIKASDFSIFLRENNLVTRAGFPTKFVESISAGIPVLTNGSSNIEDYLRDGVNGFILERNESLMKSFQKVFACSRSELNEMKIACENDIRFNYTEYLQSFDELLSKTN